MCGIAGYTGPEIPGLLLAMTDALSHRGPDGDGRWSGGPGAQDVVHLGHRRLAVIDVGGGAQPMTADGGRIAITFNGEIYNFEDLRRPLAEAHSFVTRSDTEVLLRALQRWGDAALPRLDGMFAFAWWDRAAGDLLIAVDRFGQKPLVWSVTAAGTLVFASELRAVELHPGMSSELDRGAIARMLALDAPPAPSTALKGVHRLEPGTAVRFAIGADGRVVRQRAFRWFEPQFGGAAARAPAPEEFDAALREAVRRHLVSDVPLGVLLSGGIDSTAVAQAAARERRIVTISLGFEEAAFDETATARRTAEVLGTEHHELRLGGLRAVETLDAVMSHLDEPLADASCLPAWELFRAARSKVTVAVGGDGCDELLEGYPTFRALDLARAFPWLGAAPVRAVLGPAVRAIPIGEGYYPLGYKARRFVAGMGAAWWWRPLAYLGSCGPELLRRLLLPEVRAAAELPGDAAGFADALYAPACPAELRPWAAALDPRDFAVWSHLRNYLAGEVLRKVDRMSMAHGLEVRAPMLGDPFAGTCLGAPPSARRSGKTGKLPLRTLLAAGPLAHVVGLPKRGFAVPVSRWLRSEFRPLADEVFLSPASPLRDWCAAAPLERLWTRHRDGRDDARRELWALFALGLWLDRRRTRRAAATRPARS